MEESTVKLPLIGPRPSLLRSAKFFWLTDIADLFVLWCSFALTTISIVYLSILLHQMATVPYLAFIPSKIVSFLPRIISSLSLTVTSAVIVVAGKRYVLFKLAGGGLRAQRVAVYSSPTIMNMASHLILYGSQLPLLGLVAVWVLALVTGLTVNNSWQTGSTASYMMTSVPSGPLDVTSNQSWVAPAIGQLTFIMSSWCLELTDIVKLINVVDPNAGGGSSRLPMGIISYPPFNVAGELLPDNSFSATTTSNGFNISVEQLTSIPSTAQSHPLCTQDTLQLLYDWSDNQTLSLVAVDGVTFRINATAIIMGGTLSFNGSSTVFALNGTSWPNVMSTGNQWAEDLANVICNATLPSIMGKCWWSQTDLSFLEFVSLLNDDNSHFVGLSDEVGNYQYWSSVLNMAIGAYSSAVLLSEYSVTDSPTTVGVLINQSGAGVRLAYGSYILCLNVVVSIVMLVIVLWLRLASPLGPDFLNSTRLLLDPFKKPELFNASLQATVDAHADPYMLVGPDNEFILAEQKIAREPTKRRFGMLGMFRTRKRTRSGDFCEHCTTDAM